MASITLHDPSLAAAQWEEDFLQPQKCVTVRLLALDTAAHQEACGAARNRAWDAAVQMVHTVLSAAEAATEAAAPPGATKATGRGYSADAVCRAVRTLVELDDAERTFESLNESFKAYTVRVMGLLDSVCANDSVGDVTFTRLAHAWAHYRSALGEISEVWVYLDRWYVRKFAAAKSIKGLAVSILRDALLRHEWLLQRGQVGFLRGFHRDLEAIGSGRQELNLFTDLCVAVQVYYLRAEPELISVATDFYTSRSDSMWADGTPAERFFTRVESFLEEGRRRVAECLEAGSLAKLEAAAQHSLLLTHGVSFLERDFARLTQEGRYDIFRLAWRLLAAGKFVRLGKQCGSVFRSYIAREGANIIRHISTSNNNPNSSSNINTNNSNNIMKDDSFVTARAMIALMYRGEEVIQKGFEEDSMAFSVQLRDALGESLQENQIEFAEQLARYLDYTIREGATDNMAFSSVAQARARPSIGVTSTVDGVLQDIGRIYSLFPGKDIFEAFYWRDLSRRLLNHHHALRMDIEEFFIQCLKETSGAEVSKFEGMLNDIRASEELNERYKAWIATDLSTAWPPRMDIENDDEEQKRDAPTALSSHRDAKAEDLQTTDEANEEEDPNEDNDSFSRSMLAQTDVRLHILTNGFWPQQSPLALRLPRPFRVLARGVGAFYRHCFADRRLVWHHQLSSAVLRCSLGGVRRQLTGTLLQCAMLLALEDMSIGPAAHVTVRALCGRIGVSHTQLDTAGALLGLCHSKLRLVLHSSSNSNNNNNSSNNSGGPTQGPSGADGSSPLVIPNATALAEEDRLQLNPNFTAAGTRCRIPTLSARRRGAGNAAGTENDEKDAQLVAEQVIAERAYVIEAAVARFMKEKRQATHDELVAAIPTLVRFTLSMTVLKKVIDRLIERGYIERNGPAATNRYSEIVMWFSALTRDLEDFTHSLVEDTRSLASMVTRMAAEVTGQSPLVAGDEDSLLAQECPLNEDAVHALQRSDSVYLEPIDEEKERKLFDEWRGRSVYSSANIHAHEQSTGDRSGSGSDEAAMTYRQRLLDDSAIMREKFEAFVRAPPGDQAVPLPPEEAAAAERMTEDTFFDRYFFRLSQLRLHAAEARREREAELAQRAKGKKSLAERLMEATDELVGWGDDRGPDSPDSPEGPEDREGAGPRSERERHVAGLEDLVRVLQRELAAQRGRTAAVLRAARECGLRPAQMERLEAAAAGTEEREREEGDAEAVPLDGSGEAEEGTPATSGQGVESMVSSPNTQLESDGWTKV